MAAKAEQLKPWNGDLSILYDHESPNDEDHWYSGANAGGMTLGFGRLAGLKINEASLTYLKTDSFHRRNNYWLQPYIQPYQRYLAGLRRFAGTDFRGFVVPFGQYKGLQLCQIPDEGYWEWTAYTNSARIYPIFFIAVRTYLEYLQNQEYVTYLAQKEDQENSDNEEHADSAESDLRTLAADEDSDGTADDSDVKPDEPNTADESLVGDDLDKNEDKFIVADPKTDEEDNVSVISELDPLEAAEQRIKSNQKHKSRSSLKNSHNWLSKSPKKSYSSNRVIETDDENEPEDVLEDEATGAGTLTPVSTSDESDAMDEDATLLEPSPYDGIFDPDSPEGDNPQWYFGKNAGGITLGLHKPWFQRYVKPYKKYRKGLSSLGGTDYKNFVVPFGQKYRGKRIGQVRDKKYLGWARQKRVLLERYPLFFAAVNKFFENPHHQEVLRDIGERCDQYEDDLELDADEFTPADAEQPDTDDDDFIVSDSDVEHEDDDDFVLSDSSNSDVEHEDNDEDSEVEEADKDIDFFVKEQKSNTRSCKQTKPSKGKNKARLVKRHAKRSTITTDCADDADSESERKIASSSKRTKSAVVDTKIKSESLQEKLDWRFGAKERKRAALVKTSKRKEPIKLKYETYHAQLPVSAPQGVVSLQSSYWGMSRFKARQSASDDDNSSATAKRRACNWTFVN
ncbi:hypothetical protein CPB83DRAFT_910707 [Crepidotus variabilis]|uniref:Uncharacterized protein n=1 Tax=Crepidotus variabilis TaxID=179855 RepID=A0A9P6E6M8_9AGAR|nr:hypothetical protein CPB83DRAFT_910707 [Crepidotus variabilis]